MTLADHVRSYVAFKRATGLSFQEQERALDRFAAAAETRDERFLRARTVLEWASQAGSLPMRQKRLRFARGLAVYLHAEDERHEIPPRDAFGRAVLHRPPPRLLSLAQVRQIMAAALELPPQDSITPVTFHYLIGLLAATGLRRAEAVGLHLADVTPDGLRIREAKAGKQRLVPLHESVRAALDRYLQVRLRCGSANEHLFVLARGGPVAPDYLTGTFVQLARDLGLRGGPGQPGTRLHDLRHHSESRIIPSRIRATGKRPLVFTVLRMTGCPIARNNHAALSVRTSS